MTLKKLKFELSNFLLIQVTRYMQNGIRIIYETCSTTYQSITIYQHLPWYHRARDTMEVYVNCLNLHIQSNSNVTNVTMLHRVCSSPDCLTHLNNAVRFPVNLCIWPCGSDNQIRDVTVNYERMTESFFKTHLGQCCKTPSQRGRHHALTGGKRSLWSSSWTRNIGVCVSLLTPAGCKLYS